MRSLRSHLEPTVALFECRAEPTERQADARFTIRDADGRWTDEYLAMRAEMGTVGLRR